MTRRDLLAFLFRYKGTIVGWWIFIVLVVGAMAYTAKPTYEAMSSVLVERTRAPVITARQYNAPEMAEAMNTEVEILRSRTVVEAVISNLRLDQPGSGDGAEDRRSGLSGYIKRLKDYLAVIGLRHTVDRREGWVETLYRGLDAEPIVDSNVLTITYASSEPLLSMKVVNAVTDAYIAHRRGIFAARGASDYFRERMEEAAEELDALRARLEAYRADVSVSALLDNRSDLVREVSELRSRLITLRAERADLMSRFTDSHPRVVVADQNIEATQRQLDERSTEIRELEDLQTKIDGLQGLIDNQETAFLNYKSEFEQERAREGAPEDLVNVRVIAYATMPAKPKRSPMFYIKVALVAGLLLGTLMAFVRAYFDNRVADPDQVERALGVPVVGSIPKKRALRHV